MAAPPFLFASDDTLPNPGIDVSLFTQEPEEVPDGVVEIKRPKKRTESEASSTSSPSGRQFPKHTSTASASEPAPRQQSEISSPEQASAGAAAEEEKPRPRRRLPHNQVERKYRESLNTQLDSLRRVVPALKQNLRGCEGADIEDLPTPSKPSKAVVLASATAYIKQMEKDKRTLADENDTLRRRVKALQALVKCEDCSLRQYFINLKINQAT